MLKLTLYCSSQIRLKSVTIVFLNSKSGSYKTVVSFFYENEYFLYCNNLVLKIKVKTKSSHFLTKTNAEPCWAEWSLSCLYRYYIGYFKTCLTCLIVDFFSILLSKLKMQTNKSWKCPLNCWYLSWVTFYHNVVVKWTVRTCTIFQGRIGTDKIGLTVINVSIRVCLLQRCKSLVAGYSTKIWALYCIIIQIFN